MWGIKRRVIKVNLDSNTTIHREDEILRLCILHEPQSVATPRHGVWQTFARQYRLLQYLHKFDGATYP